jgi:steroid delta-isomerase-like uncharacterized protein
MKVVNFSKRRAGSIDRLTDMKHGIRFTALLVMLIHCIAANGKTEDRITVNKEIVRKIYEEAINRGRLDMLSELVAADYQGPDGAKGPAGFRATVERLRSGFPDIRFTIDQLIGEGEHVVVRWHWEATHDGPFAGIAPTHKHLTNSGIAIYELRNGRVARSFLETDRLGALQQLGVVPQQFGPRPQK